MRLTSCNLENFMKIFARYEKNSKKLKNEANFCKILEKFCKFSESYQQVLRKSEFRSTAYEEGNLLNI